MTQHVKYLANISLKIKIAKRNKRKKFTVQKMQNKMKTHLVKENGSEKCSGKTHNEKTLKKSFKTLTSK
jgi:hypothetical protein